MSKRTLCFDWSGLQGARKKKRKLYFEEDPAGLFVCPVQTCLHEGYKSKRGLRKHVNSCHEWYLYFDMQPEVKREDAQPRVPARRKASTHKQPGFSVEEGCGARFLEWLLTPCGGGKTTKDAKQIAKRAMKYLMYCIGDSEDGFTAPESYIDCCLGSPTMLMKFLKVIVEEWGLKAAGAISYLQSVTDLLDYRKCQGIPDTTLRLFAVTEVYLRRSKSTLYKKRNLEYSRDLNLETLIAQNSWATLAELEEVIPFHSPRYKDIYTKAGENQDQDVTIPELAFATRFIIAFLLLRVKCTRPMSLQYLTLEMLDAAMANDGFVDQTKFKTSDRYIYDTLKFSPDALEVVDMYRERIRPLCGPKCEYVIVTTGGTQYTAFCNALSVLTFESIGKHITPTRYRAIVETESTERLNKEQQATITKDQKHSSYIARRCYQKSLSRDVAANGAVAMKELVGKAGEQHTSTLVEALRGSVTAGHDSNPGSSQSQDDRADVIEVSDESSTSAKGSPINPTIVIEPITVGENDVSAGDEDVEKEPFARDDIEVKKEELKTGKRFRTFTTEEDKFLRDGFAKYDKSLKKWSDILKDKVYQFQEGRTRDSLRVRATSLGLDKSKKKLKGKSASCK